MSLRERPRKSRASHTALSSNRRHDPAVPLRVLIVDDNSAFRAAARQLLERAGFVVVAEAGDGGEGLRAAKEHTPDLAIVDVQLPDLDGFELAERLRAAERSPEVILTSSLDGTDFGELVAASSALGFIPKAELSAPAIGALLARTP
jgi:CheY-like chemotaxis protein